MAIKRNGIIEIEKNDIIQITKEGHPWFPCLLIVDKIHEWGVQAYALIPESNDGSKPVGEAYTRIPFGDFALVGMARVFSE
jgi:hypothetical protein